MPAELDAAWRMEHMDHTAFEPPEHVAVVEGGNVVAMCASRWGDALFVGTADGLVVLLAGEDLEWEAEALLGGTAEGGVTQLVAADALGLVLALAGGRVHALDQSSLAAVHPPAAAPPGATLLAACDQGLRLAVMGEMLWVYDLAPDAEAEHAAAAAAPATPDARPGGGVGLLGAGRAVPGVCGVTAAAWLGGELLGHAARLHTHEASGDAPGGFFRATARGAAPFRAPGAADSAAADPPALALALPPALLLLVHGARGALYARDAGAVAPAPAAALAWPAPPQAAAAAGEYLAALLPGARLALHCIAGVRAHGSSSFGAEPLPPVQILLLPAGLGPRALAPVGAGARALALAGGGAVLRLAKRGVAARALELLDGAAATEGGAGDGRGGWLGEVARAELLGEPAPGAARARAALALLQWQHGARGAEAAAEAVAWRRALSAAGLALFRGGLFAAAEEALLAAGAEADLGALLGLLAGEEGGSPEAGLSALEGGAEGAEAAVVRGEVALEAAACAARVAEAARALPPFRQLSEEVTARARARARPPAPARPRARPHPRPRPRAEGAFCARAPAEPAPRAA